MRTGVPEARSNTTILERRWSSTEALPAPSHATALRRGRSGGGAVRAPAGLVGVVGRAGEAHHALVEVVGDEHAAGAVDRHAVGEVELARPRTLAEADRLEHMAAGVHRQHAVVLVVGDQQPG